jgi:hypothetical protein
VRSFEHVNSYPASAAEVLEMLTSQEFREHVCTYQEALEHTVRIVRDGSVTEVEITRTQSMKGAPSIATKVVGDTVRIVQRERWTGADTAELVMEIPGKPGHLRGTIRLVPNYDGGTDEVFRGEVKVGVPLVGGRLEAMIDEILRRALRREGRVGASWLGQD